MILPFWTDYPVATHLAATRWAIVMENVSPKLILEATTRATSVVLKPKPNSATRGFG